MINFNLFVVLHCQKMLNESLKNIRKSFPGTKWKNLPKSPQSPLHIFLVTNWCNSSALRQMCLALRYLHKEKRIVHRDLTPNNIMLGEKDKVTISECVFTVHYTSPHHSCHFLSCLITTCVFPLLEADFGLAKQKQESSKLTSVVGTILYSW